MIGGTFLSDYIKRIFLPHIERFREAVEERILPTFETIDAEAEEYAKEVWEKAGSRAGPDTDPADLAERAMESGIDRYIELANVLQTFLNMSAVALHHLVEQQLIIVAREVADEPRQLASLRREEAIELLQEQGIDPKGSESWSGVEILRHAANTIKHGEGSAARKLRELRPDLLKPIIVGDIERGSLSSPPPRVEDPLEGHHIYISERDLKRFFDVVEAFWNDLRANLAPGDGS